MPFMHFLREESGATAIEYACRSVDCNGGGCAEHRLEPEFDLHLGCRRVQIGRPSRRQGRLARRHVRARTPLQGALRSIVLIGRWGSREDRRHFVFSDLHPISALGLGTEERGIGRDQQRSDVGVEEAAGGSDADGGADLAAIDAHRRRREGLACALGRGGRVRQRPRHDHGELLAAEASDQVGGAKIGARDGGEQARDIVAGLVTEAIVDRFELIEIEHQRTHRLAAFGVARDRQSGLRR
jgi:hypothetical protein